MICGCRRHPRSSRTQRGTINTDDVVTDSRAADCPCYGPLGLYGRQDSFGTGKSDRCVHWLLRREHTGRMARPVPVLVDPFLPALHLLEAKPRSLSAGLRPGSPGPGRLSSARTAGDHLARQTAVATGRTRKRATTSIPSGVASGPATRLRWIHGTDGCGALSGSPNTGCPPIHSVDCTVSVNAWSRRAVSLDRLLKRACLLTSP